MRRKLTKNEIVERTAFLASIAEIGAAAARARHRISPRRENAIRSWARNRAAADELARLRLLAAGG